MTEFHVGAGPLTGNIYAGTLTSRKNWKTRCDVTEEAVHAVIDHMMTQKIEHYTFEKKDGSQTITLTLKVEIKNE